jgi:RNase H-like domain found in reverse transcriptase
VTQEAFNNLKTCFTRALILATYNLEKGMLLKTNALDKAIRRCISQIESNRILHLIAYYLRKITLAKLNYNVYNKKLFAIVDTIEH